MITPPVGINLYVVQGLRKRGAHRRRRSSARRRSSITMLLMIVICVAVRRCWARTIASWSAVRLAADGDHSRQRRSTMIAAGVELGAAGAGRDDAGGVVLLDDERARRPSRDRRASGPACRSSRARRRNRRGARGLRRSRTRLGTHGSGHARAFAQALADHLDRDQLDRLVRSGAVAVGALVLAPKASSSAPPCARRSARPAPAR